MASAGAPRLLSVLTTNQRGALAEVAITKAALEIGWDVYRPIAEGGRYDLIFEVGQALLRVQCKSAPLRGDVVVLRSYSTRRTGDGCIKKPYVAGEIDALAAYCFELDKCYLVSFDVVSGAKQLSLRVSQTRNNQRQRVHLASAYEFGATLPQARLGPIAQLGERRAGSAKVAGSSPAGSTL